MSTYVDDDIWRYAVGNKFSIPGVSSLLTKCFLSLPDRYGAVRDYVELGNEDTFSWELFCIFLSDCPYSGGEFYNLINFLNS